MITSETLTEFKAVRIRKSATISLNGTLEEVFPLFGPVREKDWTPGWDPKILFSENALVEEHMIFQTTAHLGEKYLWIVSRFEPDEHLVEYTVSATGRVWFIRVACTAAGAKTYATISYTYTGLTEEGSRRNSEALAKMYAHDLEDWEEAINYYLNTGKQLLSNQ